MSKPKVLFLDDMDERHKHFKLWHGVENEVTYVYTFEDCIDKLKNNYFDVVFLDHDLSIDAILCDPSTCKEKTGSDVAKEMCEIFKDKEKKPLCIVHSLNPAGSANMRHILLAGEFKVYLVSFLNVKHVQIKEN